MDIKLVTCVNTCRVLVYAEPAYDNQTNNAI